MNQAAKSRFWIIGFIFTLVSGRSGALSFEKLMVKAFECAPLPPAVVDTSLATER